MSDRPKVYTITILKQAKALRTPDERALDEAGECGCQTLRPAILVKVVK